RRAQPSWRVPSQRGSREARRALHATGSGGRAQARRALERGRYMTGEIGLLALCLALAIAIVQSVAGISGARRNGGRVAAIASGAAMGLLVFTGLALAALIFAFVESDFSILDVAQNSHTAKPLLYKLTGA